MLVGFTIDSKDKTEGETNVNIYGKRQSAEADASVCTAASHWKSAAADL